MESIRKSFLTCAITTSVDGCDDDQIHSFKIDQPCAEGRPLLQAEVAKLLPSLPDDTDPFASNGDDEEAERNETCIDEDTDCFVSDDDNEEAERNETCIDEDNEYEDEFKDTE